MPREADRKLADMGYADIVSPEQYGGLGLGVFEYDLITRGVAARLDERGSLIARGNGPRRSAA